MKSIKPTLTIGKLAKSCGVNIETIRHYQRQGLITEPPKPDAGFRHYPQETIDRVKFIKRAQKLGFSLKEIQQLLLLGSEHCEDVQALAQEKRELVQRQIEGLMTIKSVLDELICSCQEENNEIQCAFIEALSQKGFLNDE
ncbi:Hg(II)-responsive transcriptional regulator [Aliikangiella sp. IMCC44359]|uniref:Hg(II)-responsive transcriptional regulator n=1 Tax=Aliikangiella sp. IMCC44359 TaxID=3459125 RepID=UPI00403AE7FC